MCVEGSDNKLMEVRSVFEYDCSWIGGGQIVDGRFRQKLMEVRGVFEYDCSRMGSRFWLEGSDRGMWWLKVHFKVWSFKQEILSLDF